MSHVFQPITTLQNLFRYFNAERSVRNTHFDLRLPQKVFHSEVRNVGTIFPLVKVIAGFSKIGKEKTRLYRSSNFNQLTKTHSAMSL